MVMIIELILQAYRISRLTAVPSLMRAVLPAFQSQKHLQVTKSLKLLVLSGEDFPVLLWKMLSSIFHNTSILNLYGSTEVRSGHLYVIFIPAYMFNIWFSNFMVLGFLYLI